MKFLKSESLFRFLNIAHIQKRQMRKIQFGDCSRGSFIYNVCVFIILYTYYNVGKVLGLLHLMGMFSCERNCLNAFCLLGKKKSCARGEPEFCLNCYFS